MKPSFIPKSSREYSKATTTNGSAVEDTHPWLFMKGCPKGSIPITRMSYMDHILAENNVTGRNYLHLHSSRYLRKHGRTINDKKDRRNHEYAIVTVEDRRLYGASAHFSVHQPRVENDRELSIAQIWIISGDAKTTLEAGWMVNPTAYGRERKTTFFTYWTADNYEHTGCYNLRCPGFVQTHSDFNFDAPLQPLSVIDGPQHDVKIEIYQDHLGNWWLQFRGVEVGYWPWQIVRDLTYAAHAHHFGGEIANVMMGRVGRHTWTRMGSGVDAVQGLGRAAYVRNVGVVVGRARAPYVTPGPRDFGTSVTNPNCYDLVIGGGPQSEWGLHFFYGGSGSSETCH